MNKADIEKHGLKDGDEIDLLGQPGTRFLALYVACASSPMTCRRAPCRLLSGVQPPAAAMAPRGGQPCAGSKVHTRARPQTFLNQRQDSNCHRRVQGASGCRYCDAHVRFG